MTALLELLSILMLALTRVDIGESVKLTYDEVYSAAHNLKDSIVVESKPPEQTDAYASDSTEVFDSVVIPLPEDETGGIRDDRIDAFDSPEVFDSVVIPPAEDGTDTRDDITDTTLVPSISPRISTLGPTYTFVPTLTNSPTYNDLCNICTVPGYSVTDRNATIILEGLAVSCGSLQDWADEKNISPDICDEIRKTAPISCSCRVPSPSPQTPTLRTFMPTSTMYPTITASPSFGTKCTFCPVANIDADVDINGMAMACRELIQAGISGFLAPDLCLDAQDPFERDCGCMPTPSPVSVTTFAPTATTYPTDTNSPTYTEKCSICSPLRPNTSVMVGEYQYTCQELFNFGHQGFVPTGVCELAIEAVEAACECTDQTEIDITSEPSLSYSTRSQAARGTFSVQFLSFFIPLLLLCS